MDLAKRITIGLLFIFIFGIGIFTLAKNIAGIQDIRLTGVEVKGGFPKISLKSFWAGEFQTRLDKWLSTNLGLRGAFVRLDNQINFSFFNEISSKYETKIILGKDRWLYEKSYIDSLNRRDEVPQKFLEDKVRSLKKLQALLESNGIHFLFLITPSKATIYPEYIKDKYMIPQNSAKESNYEILVPLLQEYGVRYLDGHQYLLALKKRGPYPVYPASGTHWNYYSAGLFTLEFISSLEEITKQKMANFQVDRICIRSEPFGEDSDLASLSNVLFTKSLYGRRYYYLETSTSVSVENVCRPRMLFVGGSYLVALHYYLDKHQVYSERDFYFYYKENAKYPAYTFNPIDRMNLDLKREILRKDIVVIETNEAVLSQLDFGFIEDALKALEKD
jgi:hypothetical protein